jgi:hypothetical protein
LQAPDHDAEPSEDAVVWYFVCTVMNPQLNMVVSIVPTQHEGLRTGASVNEESATRHDAILLFEKAKKRLLDINRWHSLCGEGSAEFSLTNEQGELVADRDPRVGDLIRIKLPAPPDPAGDGYDWVRIEEFENKKDLLRDEDIFGFRVRPVKSPFRREAEAAHFYTTSATSTFLVVRTTSTVTAMEKGRNEVPNSLVKALASRIRNVAIAIGAWLGFSKSQWTKLVKGIIKGPPQD